MLGFRAPPMLRGPHLKRSNQRLVQVSNQQLCHAINDSIPLVTVNDSMNWFAFAYLPQYERSTLRTCSPDSVSSAAVQPPEAFPPGSRMEHLSPALSDTDQLSQLM